MTCRHALTRRALVAAIILFSCDVAFATEERAEKMSKQKIGYQDEPKDVRMCATCTLFQPPNACKVVQGEISPMGWCTAFELAD